MASGQVDSGILRKAREAGLSDEQLEAIFQSSDPPPVAPASGNVRSNNRNDSRDDSSRGLAGNNPFEPPPHDSLFRRRESVFGQSLFRSSKLTFVSDFNIPTPANYVLGPGDELIVDVWGASELNFQGKITPEGNLHIAGAGPVQLSGCTIDQATQKIRTSLGRIVSGLGRNSDLKVSLGNIRSVNVHVMGDVHAPGTYTVPALSTVFNVLHLAGGPDEIGSLREIRLMRNSLKAAEVDVYETLIYGKTEGNVRLEEGDVILVPPYHARVRIEGEVRRPCAYELRPGETLENLLVYSGGFKSDAYRSHVTLHRRSGRQYRIHTVEECDFDSFSMQDGDSVCVGRIIDRYANRLTIKGAVWRPGEYEYGPESDCLSRLIARAEHLKGDQFADRGQITRLRPDFTTEIIPFSVSAVVRGETDVELHPEDEVYIPSLDEMTERRYIVVRGEVNRPDTLEFRHNMTIEDAIIGAGGLRESASLARAAVARLIKDPDAEAYSGRLAETFSFHIRPDLSLSAEQAAFTLKPFDEVYIRRSPVYFALQSTSVSGQILFEGEYAFSRVGERLSELIARAGGVTPEAYIRGASLIRTMTVDERAKVEAKLAIANANLGRDSVDVRMLDITNTYSVGIDLEKALRHPGGIDDIVLRDGDRIYIPKLDNTVKISGSVLSPNTVTFTGGRLDDYISQAGGYTDAARRRPFIVYMNGKMASTRRGFLHKRYPRVEPGCEIIVPERSVRNNHAGLPDILSLATSSTALAAMLSGFFR